jgi:hypothetical protein
MKFFAKLTFILNTCFLLMVALRAFLPPVVSKTNANNIVVPLQGAAGVVAILGTVAIIINAVFLLASILWYKKVATYVPKWLLLLNSIIFVLQVFYFFT